MQMAGNCQGPDAFVLFSDVFYVRKWLEKTMNGAGGLVRAGKSRKD